MAEQVDLLSTETGLIDDCVGTVLTAKGIRPEKYPNVLVEWIIGTDNPDHPEVKESYTAGKGWEIIEDGSKLAHEAGDAKRFHANAGYGQIIDLAVGKFGMKDELVKRGADPRNLAMFVGFKFRFERIKKSYTIDLEDAAEIAANNGNKKKTGETSRLMPVEFLGVDTSVAATMATTGTDALTQLTELAKLVDEATFKSQGLAIAGADKFLGSILDGSLYKGARG